MMMSGFRVRHEPRDQQHDYRETGRDEREETRWRVVLPLDAPDAF